MPAPARPEPNPEDVRLSETQHLIMKHLDQTLKPTPTPEIDPRLYRHEMEIAAQIQNSLLPKSEPKVLGFEFASFYQPCEYVGGDFYDYIEIDEQYLALAIADVSGHGVPAAMVMAETRAMLRAEALRAVSPKDSMVRINRLLVKDLPRGMFVSMFYVLIDLPSGIINCASAGHNPMLFWMQEQQRLAFVNPHGIALGIDRGPIFERTIKEQKIPLSKGDMFILYTDGLVEAQNPARDLYGMKRMCVWASSIKTAPLPRAIQVLGKHVKMFEAGEPEHDDITVLCARYTGDATAETGYIDSERFVRCTFCGTVNAKDGKRCSTCSEPLQAVLSLEVNVRDDEMACDNCGKIMPKDRRSCPKCRRLICVHCRVRTAVFDAYCAVCAGPRRRPPPPPRQGR